MILPCVVKDGAGEGSHPCSCYSVEREAHAAKETVSIIIRFKYESPAISLL